MAEKTSTGLDANMANALCYAPVVGGVASIVFLIVEKDKAVKWNALQSLLLSLSVGVLWTLLAVTFILALFIPILMLASFILQLVLTAKAYQGQTMKLPVVSGWADKLVKKF